VSIRRITSYGFAQRFIAPKYPRLAEIIAYPMVRPILDRIDAHPGCIFIVLGATQIFKTLLGQIHALRAQLVEPVPALWYEKNSDSAEEIAEEKFNPLYDSCMPTVIARPGASEPTVALLYADRNKRTKTGYTLPTGHIQRFLSAGVKLNRQSKSAQDIYFNEPWEFEPGWIKDIQSRREDYPRFREIHMMTGPTWGSYSHELWEMSSKEVWHMRCTACHKLIPPEFGDGEAPGGIRYESGPSVRDKDGERILSATRATVHLVCPNCGAVHANSDHTRNALNAGGMLVATNPNPEFHIHGFRCPALPLRDWANIAVEKITADRARRRGDLTLTEELHRKRFADVWREDSHLHEKKSRPIARYKLKEEWAGEALDPDGRPVRCATVDVQLDHFVLVIRMWGKNGESRLRWCEKVTTPGRVRDLCMENGVIPERVYLDARHEPDYVRRVAAAHGWRVLMGEDDKDYYHKASGLRRIFSEPRWIDAGAGTARVSGVVAQFMFSKQSALTRLHLLRTLPSASDDLVWSVADNAPEWYWKEIDAHYRKKLHATDGSEYYVWQGLRDDHAGDCEAMQIVFASMAGLVGAESLDTEAKHKPAA
jgi:uncharacterized C2H2 Zn-finger protein